MKDNREEMLPQIVEDRLQEAYDKIRRGEIRQMKTQNVSGERTVSKKSTVPGKKKTKGRRSWLSAAAVLLMVIMIPSAVYAAVVYFQKTERLEEGILTYEFAINYELVPGEYRVKAEYIPEGFTDDDGYGKYYGENEEWISIMPVYTTARSEEHTSELQSH